MDASSLTWVHDPTTYALATLITFVGAVLLAILKGTLVPRRSVDSLAEVWERRITESLGREQAWKTAHDKAVAALDMQTEQVDRLTVLGETTVALLKALPDNRSGSSQPRRGR